MAIEFKFPDVGEGITEGTIVKWRFKTGDKVKEHETICDVETDKAIVQIPSPASGTLLEIRKKEGEVVKVGEVLAVIGGAGEKVSAKTTVAQPAKTAPKKFYGVVGELEEAPEEEEEAKPATPSKITIMREVLATPAVRALAKKKDVDIHGIKGSGPGGRITEQDVNASTKTLPVAKTEVPPGGVKVSPRYDLYGYIERVPLAGIRRATARHMEESAKHQVLVTTFDDVDVTDLVALKEKEAPKLKKKGMHLTFLPFVLRACVHVLKMPEHKYVNASLDDQTQEILIKKYYNIGIAVDTPEGLLVPILKRADEKTMNVTIKELQDLIDKAKKRTIDLADLQGGTFTVTSFGGIGGTYATPIPNYPESAILGVGKIQEKPVFVDGKIVARKFMPLSLTFDHKVFDGAEASRFLNDLKEVLEDPDELLMD
ncbi:MAG TPA: dihydrolipoamide acetyltransferase family protein [Candidatus Norongarragalinales archaeon]|jgi:pyruvate dehydrogenase E2 component (dihydrolipoamide acetyltransferase)|nr:dihydrolipoamide acetyltransferase family protein [Candidatus Norongarragalinales archaeon]